MSSLAHVPTAIQGRGSHFLEGALVLRKEGVCGLSKQQCALATNCYCCQAEGDKQKVKPFFSLRRKEDT